MQFSHTVTAAAVIVDRQVITAAFRPHIRIFVVLRRARSGAQLLLANLFPCGFVAYMRYKTPFHASFRMYMAIPLLIDSKNLGQAVFAIVAGEYLQDRTVRENSSSKVLLYLANESR